MKQFKKVFILLFTCSVPILFFFFLKFFTKNHYEIPIIKPSVEHEQVCEDATLFFQSEKGKSVKLFEQDSLVKIVMLMDVFSINHDKSMVQLDRLIDQMKVHKNFQIFVLANPERLSDYRELMYLNPNYESLSFLASDSLRNTAFVNCKAFLKDFSSQTNVFLFDEKNRLRGRYQGSDADDMDRLSTELSILYY